MTVFAGFIKLNDDNISLNEHVVFKDKFEIICKVPITYEFISSHHSLIHFDSGVYSENSILSDAEKTIIAGKPIISNNNDINIINAVHDIAGLKACLSRCRGVFSGIKKTSNDDVYLFTDKLGVRPIYYYVFENIIIYSSLLSFIESLSNINLSIDEIGFAEYVAFGYCLSTRTQYKHIKRIDAGEILFISRDRKCLVNHFYWDWRTIAEKPTLENKEIEILYRTFLDAIELRLNQKESAVAFLSGGLDSRALVSILNALVENVYTFNYSTSLSQDNEFARRFAEAAGLNHREEVLSELSFPNWSQLIANSISDDDEIKNLSICKHEVWSGDGGSVSTGGVYIKDELTNNSDVVKNILSSLDVGLPKRFFKDNVFIGIDGLLEDSVANELSKYPFDDLKKIYYFLMLNDQRRHLDKHFETICQHKTELLLPFFDSVFLEQLFSIPVQNIINHKLYMKWFDLFPETSRITPWQTYPGHIACPIKIDDSFGYQWVKRNPKYKKRFTELKSSFSLLDSATFKYFDKKKVYMAMCLHLLGIRDYGYLLASLRKFHAIKIS